MTAHFGKRTSTPKLLLLDLQMPVMCGLDALWKLKEQGCCGVAPIVIFSSLENPEKVNAAYSAGATLYLKKPARLKDYQNVARLCALCPDILRQLPDGLIRQAFEVDSFVKMIGMR